jgi:uncharacterized protein YraI
VRAIVEKATQFDPRQRYQRAGQLTQAFTAALAPPIDPPPHDVPAHPPEKESILSCRPELPQVSDAAGTVDVARPRRSQLMQVGLVAVSLVILVGLALSVWGPFGSKNSPGAASASPSAPPFSLVGDAAAPTTTPVPTAIPTPTATETPLPSPSSTSSPTPTATAIPSPTPPVITVWDAQTNVYTAPGDRYEVLGEIRRGNELRLLGLSETGEWWLVDYLGRQGWIRAQPPETTLDLALIPVVTAMPRPTIARTKLPESTIKAATGWATPTRPPTLQNPGFEGIRNEQIPGWHWWAYDNYSAGPSDSATSYDTPLIKQADDAARLITGPTLQIDAAGFLKFRVHVYQTVAVAPGARVNFAVSAQAFADVDRIKLAAGIDPNGGRGCTNARWGEMSLLNQGDGVAQLSAPQVVASAAGQVTVCIYAETLYPAANNAAYFDDARLTVRP